MTRPASGSRMTSLSVSSRMRRRGSSPEMPSASRTTFNSVSDSSCLAAMLTLTDGASKPSSWLHVVAVRPTSISTQRPMLVISPDSSAIETKPPGGTMPRVGCAQRMSASNPFTRPDSMRTSGWNSRKNSFRSSAVRRSVSSSSHCIASVCIDGSIVRTHPLPDAFAAYMAASAFRSTPSASSSMCGRTRLVARASFGLTSPRKSGELPSRSL